MLRKYEGKEYKLQRKQNRKCFSPKMPWGECSPEADRPLLQLLLSTVARSKESTSYELSQSRRF
jgi:hypothetical protein